MSQVTRVLPVFFLCFLLSIALPPAASCQGDDAPPPPIEGTNGDDATAAEPSPADTEPLVVKDENNGTSAEAAKKKVSFLSKINNHIEGVLWTDVSFGVFTSPELDKDGNPVLDENGAAKEKTVKFPLMVAVLIIGAIFFTFWYRFISIRLIRHSVDVIRGKFDRPGDKGEITHFRALTSALSATVGLGNISGVAIAIYKGGPGAVFWMMVAAFFGMAAKFSSCTLSQMYRKVNPDGSISGGPMYYLDHGLKSLGTSWGWLGKLLAVVFAVMVMGGAIGGGNMFQAHEATTQIMGTFDLKGNTTRYAIGIIVAILVAVVVLGGIKRIGLATSRLIPLMCGIYVLTALSIILTHISELPSAIASIFTMAFTDNAIYGGMIGVLVIGVTRAAFSNEAGLGSAAIAHAAAKTDEPVREGIVAMIGPFIDTIIVCLMTASVIIITGVWSNPELAELNGVMLTNEAFKSAFAWFPYVLTVCVVFFAYSTMIAWCYYGERGWIYLLDHVGEGAGLKSVVVFRILFVLAVVWGSVSTLDDIILFSNFMILSMAFPNIVGSIILAPTVWRKAKDYWDRLNRGEIKPVGT